MAGAIFWSIIVASLFIIAIVAFARSMWIIRKWELCSAEIVDYEEAQAEEGGTMHHPKFIINCDESTPSPMISNWGSWRRPWAIGTNVKVRVHPTDKHRAEIQCFANLFGISATFFAMGMIVGSVLYFST